MRSMQAARTAKNGFLVAFLGLGLAGLGLTSGQAWAAIRAEPVAAPTTEGIEVKVEESFTNAATIRGWIEERASRTREQLEPKLAEGDLVRIVVRGGAFDYHISLELLREGKALAAEHQPSEIACACSSDEMLETVAKAVEAGVRTLDESAKREREEAEAAAERQRRADEQRRLEAERKHQEAERGAGYRPSKLGRTGIGILGVGGLVVVTGGIIAARPPQPLEYTPSLVRDWSPLGYAVLGTGAAAVATGLTMLVVDVVRCRRDPVRCRNPVMSWITRPALIAAPGSRGHG
jgi:hypothetical protein